MSSSDNTGARMRLFISLLLLFEISIFTSVAQDRTSISGRIIYDGPPVEEKFLKVGQERGVCSMEEIRDESVLVDSESNGLINAVVFLRDVEMSSASDFESYPTIDQRGCIFIPHVTIVSVGQSVQIRNSDGILHNFHAISTNNRPINVAMPRTKVEMQIQGRRFRRPDFIRVKCDVHEWMSAVIVVAQHPFYSISNEEGIFALYDVPPGTYDLVVWHETFGETTQSITVVGGESKTMELVLGPNGQ